MSVISKKLEPDIPNCFVEFSLKNRKVYQECLRSLTFCHPVILQFLVATIFFVTDCKELKRAQTTVEPRLSGLVRTQLSSPDNRKYEY